MKVKDAHPEQTRKTHLKVLGALKEIEHTNFDEKVCICLFLSEVKLFHDLEILVDDVTLFLQKSVFYTVFPWILFRIKW